MMARELQNRFAAVSMLDNTDSDPDVLSRSTRELRPFSEPVRTIVQERTQLPRAQSYRQKPGSGASFGSTVEAKSGDGVVITRFPCGGSRVALECLRRWQEVEEPRSNAPAPSAHEADRTFMKSRSDRVFEYRNGRDHRVGGRTSAHSTSALRPTHGQVTFMDAAVENTVTHQPQSPGATEAAAAVETPQVTMEKPQGNQYRQQTRDNKCLQAPQIASADSPSNHSSGAVSRVNQVLREVRQVQAEMESLVQPFQSMEIKRRAVAPSPLEDAAQVLHQIRRQTKLFNENMDLVLRAAQTEAFHRRLDAAVRNSNDWTHPAQIRRTVDAWLSLQPEKSEEKTIDGTAAQRRAPLQPVASRMGKSVTASRQTRGRMLTGNRVGKEAAAQKMEAVPPRPRKAERQLKAESYLTRRYGQSPNLPSTLSAVQVISNSHPCHMENIQGMKQKSQKTQTSLAPTPSLSVWRTSSTPAFTPSPVQPHQSSSTHPPSGDPIDDHLPIYVAVPLGPPMVSSSERWCSQPDMVPERQVQDTCESPHNPDTSRTVKIMETMSEEVVNDEENIFPGSDFLSVADIVQEEDSVAGEDPVEVSGCLATPPAQYLGPVFPPQAPTALHTNNDVPILDSNVDINAPINQLAEWVEQQVISRVILEMIPTSLGDPTCVNRSDFSEAGEQSDTSDIEAAGDSDVQRFLNANPSVDREYFQHILNDVLLHVRASILAETEKPMSRPGSEPELDPKKPRTQVQDVVLFTPAPSPLPSPDPPSNRETMTVVATPPLSESTSSLIESPARSISPVYVATPSSSPEPMIRSAGSSTTSNPPEGLLQMDKEAPEEDLNNHQQAPLTSVAEEQPPLPSPSPPPPPEPERAPPCTSLEESSTSSDESSSSYSSLSTAVTAETEAGVKHISEGELLISVNQQAVMTEEEMAVCCFSNSLQGLQDMDFDPASEGEVKGRALVLCHPVESRGERPQPEGSMEDQKEGSIGELRDDFKLKPGGPSSQMSPGQISQAADMSELSSEGIIQIQGITGDTTMDLMGTLTSDHVTDRSLSPPPDPLPRVGGTDSAAQEVMACSSASHPAAKQEVEVQEDNPTSYSSDDVF